MLARPSPVRKVNASAKRERPNGRDDRLMKSSVYPKSLSDDPLHGGIKIRDPSCRR